MSRRLRTLLLYAALTAGAAFALLPMLWMIAASFMQSGEANSFPPRLLPAHPTLEHYRALFTRLDIGRYLLNSTVVATSITAVLPSSVARTSTRDPAGENLRALSTRLRKAIRFIAWQAEQTSLWT